MRLRNRITKADFWTDPDLLSMPRDKRWLYHSLWALAEDSACVEDSPFGWKVSAWPSPLDSDITVESIAEWRDELIAAGKLVPYEANGKRYVYIPTMAEHEQPRNPQRPSIPLPEWVKWMPHASDQRKGNYEHSECLVQALYNDCTSVPAPPRPVPSRTKTPVQKRAKPAPLLDGFDEWWQEQTRKEGKGDARKSYARALTLTDAPTLLEAWRRSQAAYARENRAREKYPLPATWLNQERWTDDYTVPAPERAMRVPCTNPDCIGGMILNGEEATPCPVCR